jgi:hypothetical protein
MNRCLKLTALAAVVFGLAAAAAMVAVAPQAEMAGHLRCPLNALFVGWFSGLPGILKRPIPVLGDERDDLLQRGAVSEVVE